LAATTHSVVTQRHSAESRNRMDRMTGWDRMEKKNGSPEATLRRSLSCQSCSSCLPAGFHQRPNLLTLVRFYGIALQRGRAAKAKQGSDSRKQSHFSVIGSQATQSGHSLQCYFPTSSRSAKIFPERGQLCPRDAYVGEETRGQSCPRSFGCGSAALCLCALASLR
jgi:hypothetical protein